MISYGWVIQIIMTTITIKFWSLSLEPWPATSSLQWKPVTAVVPAWMMLYLTTWQVNLLLMLMFPDEEYDTIMENATGV